MMDLYLGIMLMVALGAASFAATRRLANFGPARLYDVAAFVTVCALCVYIGWIWDDVRLARVLPFSNLIIVGNWFLPMLGVLAGLVWRRLPEHSLRRCTATLLLFAAGLYSTVNPVLGEPPKCESSWERLGQGRCFLQTTDATCSAAAAATLLSLHGISTSEQEMADLCLTREGTTWKGLFRGLSLKTEWTPWEVEVFRGTPIDLDDQQSYPVLVCAELRPDAPHGEIYRDEYGWIPGTPHTVVVLSREADGSYVVHDPVAGREFWDEEELRLLWTGSAIRLLPRDDMPPSMLASLTGGQPAMATR